MNKLIYKITIYLFLVGSGVFHLSPDDTTWVVVLYYILNYGLVLILLLNSTKPVKLHLFDKIETGIFSVYMIGKMIYHILKVNKDWADYLKDDLNSEYWSGVFTIVILVIMLSMQGIYAIRHVKTR